MWFFLSFIAAVFVAARDVSIKTYYEELSPGEVAILELVWSLPALAAGNLMVKTPQLDQTFWWVVLISMPIYVLAYILYLYAIKISPISLSVPFLAFTPAFMIITGFFILDETINLWGGIGISLILAGGYILHTKSDQTNLFAPFAAFSREKGSWIMLIVAFILSFGAVLGKKAIIHSSPLFFTYFFFLIQNVVLLIGLSTMQKNDWRKIARHSSKGLWLGFLLMVHLSLHAIAISISTAAYMVAVKRSSILFSVLFSWFFLKEVEMKHRGIGTIFMFAGMLFIVLLG